LWDEVLEDADVVACVSRGGCLGTQNRMDHELVAVKLGVLSRGTPGCVREISSEFSMRLVIVLRSLRGVGVIHRGQGSSG
jgi:hypothetical protein